MRIKYEINCSINKRDMDKYVFFAKCDLVSKVKVIFDPMT